MAGTPGPEAPSHVPCERVRGFDYFDLGADPHAAILGLLAEPPLLYTNAMGGYWIATRARLIDEVIAQPETFSNQPIVLKAIATGNDRYVPEDMDPPDHIKYRRLLSPILARKRMAALSGFIA